MNRLIQTVILVVITSALIGGVALAGMYWDPGQDPEAAVKRAAQDARSREPSRVTAPAKPVKMYDDGQVLEVEPSDQSRSTRTPRIEPEPSAAAVRPSQARRIAPATRSVAPRSHRQTEEQVKPHAVSSSPGTLREKRKEAKTGPVVVPRSGPTRQLEAVAPPATKRMPWGKTDMRPEPPANLKWGSSKPEE